MRRNLVEVDTNEVFELLKKKEFKGVLDLGELIYIVVMRKVPKAYKMKFSNFIEENFDILSKTAKNAKDVFKLLVVELCGDFDELCGIEEDKVLIIYECLKKIKEVKMNMLKEAVGYAKESYNLNELRTLMNEMVEREKKEKPKTAEELLIEQQTERLEFNYSISKNRLKLLFASMTASLEDKDLDSFIEKYRKLRDELKKNEEQNG